MFTHATRPAKPDPAGPSVRLGLRGLAVELAQVAHGVAQLCVERGLDLKELELPRRVEAVAHALHLQVRVEA